MDLGNMGLAVATGPFNVTAAVENVSALWRVDLTDATAFQRGRFDPRAWGEASLRWLVDPGRVPDEPPSGARVGMSDVNRFRVTVDVFDNLDDRFGGGHARESLVKYLSVDANRLLHGRYNAEAGRTSPRQRTTAIRAWAERARSGNRRTARLRGAGARN